MGVKPKTSQFYPDLAVISSLILDQMIPFKKAFTEDISRIWSAEVLLLRPAQEVQSC